MSSESLLSTASEREPIYAYIGPSEEEKKYSTCVLLKYDHIVAEKGREGKRVY